MKYIDYEPYLNDRLIKRKNGYCIIVPKDMNETTPMSCSICQTLMRSKEDEIAWGSYGCCSNCALEWAEPRKESWAQGWRPDTKEVTERLNIRNLFTVKFEI